MTPGEFKAWFDGFTEAFTGCPTKAQWTRIKARVAEIDGKPVTHTVYMERYRAPEWYWYKHGGLGVGGCQTTYTTSAVGQNMVASNAAGVTVFNSQQAMADLGRAEASSLAAA